MGLRDSLEEIITFAEEVQTNNNCDNQELLKIYECNLLPFIEAKMALEFTAKTFERAKHRIPPINIFKRLIDKLAKVYAQGATRTTENSKDQQLMDDYVDLLDLDNQMAWSDTVYNAVRSCAFEPYVDDSGFPRLRVLAPHQFTVWSDNRVDPTKETVFIKFFGTVDSLDGVGEDDSCVDVNVYALYNDQEFMIVDAQLNERPELLPDSPNDVDDKTPEERGKHNFKRIPFVYQKNTKTQLVPDPNNDDKAMTILIPLLLADLNYASKYLAHGIRYGIDIDASNLEGNPDSFWVVNSKNTDEGKQGTIGVLAPAVQIEGVLKLAQNETAMWLEAKSIKAGATGEAENSVSGIAKVIDNADVTDVRKENASVFKATEEMGLWPLLAVMHNEWAADDLLNDKVSKDRFSDDFIMTLKFGDMEPVTDPKEKREDLKFKIDNELITKERAVREVNPDMEVEEQDKLIGELKVEQSNEPTNPNKESDNDERKEIKD